MSPDHAGKNSRQDHIIRVMVVVTLIVVIAGFLIGMATIWQVLNQGSTLDAQAQSEAVAGCRSEYAVALAEAEGVVDRAEARQDDTIYAGLVAYGTGGSREGVAAALADDEDLTAVIVAARANRDRIEDERREAISLSRSDPEGFLAECERRYG